MIDLNEFWTDGFDSYGFDSDMAELLLVELETTRQKLERLTNLMERMGAAVYVSYEDFEGVMRCPFCDHPGDPNANENKHYTPCISAEYEEWDNNR